MPAALLLGRDHQNYGQVHTESVTDRLAVAISIGADPRSPSLAFKADPDVLNEDALCVAVQGSLTGLAIADAHFGPESSHVLIERLHDAWSQQLPANLADLHSLMDTLGTTPSTESETALLIAIHDADNGEGFGLSVGDATLVVAGAGGDLRPRNRRNHDYISSDCGGDAEPFRFTTRPGDVVLGFTDGIDECHYRRPETSIQAAHMREIIDAACSDPLRIVDQLSTLALSGVDANPGGQDNIALVALIA